MVWVDLDAQKLVRDGGTADDDDGEPVPREAEDGPAPLARTPDGRLLRPKQMTPAGRQDDAPMGPLIWTKPRR